MKIEVILLKVTIVIVFFINFIFDNKFCVYISIIIFLIYMACYLYYYRRYFIIYLFVMYSLFSNVLSTFIIETHEMYLFELNKISQFSGAFKYAFIIMFFTNEILFVFYNKEYKKNIDIICRSVEKNISIIDKFLIITYCILITIFIIYIFNKPFWKVDIGKFGYNQKVFSGKPVYSSIKTLIMYYNVFFGYLCYKTKNKKYLFYLMLNITCYFWIGQKFSSILFMILYFIFPYLFTVKIKRIKKNFLITLVIILTVFLGNRILYMKGLSSDNEKNLMNYVYNRFSQQNQLWWYFYSNRKVYSSEINIQEIITDIKNTNANDVYKKIDSGEYKLISLAASTNTAISRAELGAPFATGVHSQLLYYTNSIAVIILYVFVWCYFYNKMTFLFLKLYYKVSSITPILVIIFSKIYKMLFEMGFQIINRLFEYDNIITIILFICIFSCEKFLHSRN